MGVYPLWAMRKRLVSWVGALLFCSIFVGVAIYPIQETVADGECVNGAPCNPFDPQACWGDPRLCVGMENTCVCVGSGSDVVVSKTGSRSSISSGSMSYTITVTNNGPQTATWFWLEDIIDTWSWTIVSVASGSYPGATITNYSSESSLSRYITNLVSNVQLQYHRLYLLTVT